MCIKMFIVILTSVLISTCVSQDLTFRIDEEQEAGTYVGKISEATDLQSALSEDAIKTLRYSFLTQGYPYSSLFKIVNSTGEIRTAVKLDREDICGFAYECVLDLEIAVQSSTSQYFRKIWTSVYLQDINDNAPKFLEDSISLHISEAVSLNSSLAVDGAVDKDIGNNSLQNYELSPRNSPFDLRVVRRLDGGTIVSLDVRRTLDREKVSSYQLVIFAKDGGSSPLTGTVTVNIDVTDVNDNAPKFVPDVYNVTVRETTLANTAILQVTATDADTPENGVSYFRFSPLQANNIKRYFRVNSTTGQLTVVSSLERVQGKTFKFYVECVDSGSPPLISQAAVTVNVNDTINSPPDINLNLLYGGLVSEYAQPGTVVAHIAVLDLDSGRNGIIQCFIVSDSFELQGLDVNEYKVIVVRGLDNEKLKQYNVTVTCKDAGSPQLNTSINFLVKVKDENDNAPRFTKDVYTASVVENVKGVVVTRVSATDLDDGINGELEYVIPHASKMGLEVLPNGEVITTTEFDREYMPKMAVPIVARDRGSPSKNGTATIMITVDDVNDVTPSFKSRFYKFSIHENRQARTVIDRVQALDLDSGDNGKVVYSIDNLKDNLPIEILSSGQLLTTRPLDRETTQEYHFTVWARDNGVQPLSSSTVVVVEVLDVNDNVPVITYPNALNSSIVVPFNSKLETSLLTVTANDADEGINSRFQFLLAPGQRWIPPNLDKPASSDWKETDTFSINANSGDLHLKRQLSAKDIGKYTVVIVVQDQGVPQFSSNVTLDVYVFANNDTSTEGEGMTEENAIVVVVLGSLTGIVTVAVIVTILVIRRADRTRKANDNNAATPPPLPRSGDDEKAPKPLDSIVIRNDVSFDSQGSGHLSFDSQGKLILGPPDGANVQPGPDGMYPGNTTAAEWSNALKIHKNLLKLHGLDPQLPRRSSDDANSDTSGEATTSDSGRGGSDEDSHGRASPVTHKVSTTSSSRQMYRHNQTADYVKNLGKVSKNSFGGTFGKCFNLSSKVNSSSIRSSRPVKHVTFQADLPSEKQLSGNEKFLDGPFYVNSNSHGFYEEGDHSFDANDDDNTTTTSGSYTVDDHVTNDLMPPRMNDVLV